MLFRSADNHPRSRGKCLRPSEVGGTFRVSADGYLLWDRKEAGGFPDMKELKQRVRDHIAPERDLGHSDTQQRQASDS